MVKEFLPYDLAVAMKRIGFNEPCLTSYSAKGELCSIWNIDIAGLSDVEFLVNVPPRVYDTNTKNQNNHVSAPLFQQAFRWFRERKYLGEVLPIDSWGSWSYRVTLEDWMSPFFIAATGDEYASFEKAQIECLKKIIEIYEGNS